MEKVDKSLAELEGAIQVRLHTFDELTPSLPPAIYSLSTISLQVLWHLHWG